MNRESSARERAGLLFENRLRRVQGKIEAVFDFRAMDFPPFLINGAFYHLFGLVVDSQFSPIVGLTPDGKYALVSREKEKTRREIFEHIGRLRAGG